MKNSTGCFSMEARLSSIRHAVDGVRAMVRSQHNAWIHLLATISVIACAHGFQVNTVEWCLLVVCIATVWAAEAFNSAIELLADAVTAEFHPLIKKSKDIAAGGVLITACGSTVVGLTVFWPYAKLLLAALTQTT